MSGTSARRHAPSSSMEDVSCSDYLLIFLQIAQGDQALLSVPNMFQDHWTSAGEVVEADR